MRRAIRTGQLTGLLSSLGEGQPSIARVHTVTQHHLAAYGAVPFCSCRLRSRASSPRSLGRPACAYARRSSRAAHAHLTTRRTGRWTGIRGTLLVVFSLLRDIAAFTTTAFLTPSRAAYRLYQPSFLPHAHLPHLPPPPPSRAAPRCAFSRRRARARYFGFCAPARCRAHIRSTSSTCPCALLCWHAHARTRHAMRSVGVGWITVAPGCDTRCTLSLHEVCCAFPCRACSHVYMGSSPFLLAVCLLYLPQPAPLPLPPASIPLFSMPTLLFLPISTLCHLSISATPACWADLPVACSSLTPTSPLFCSSSSLLHTAMHHTHIAYFIISNFFCTLLLYLLLEGQDRTVLDFDRIGQVTGRWTVWGQHVGVTGDRQAWGHAMALNM